MNMDWSIPIPYYSQGLFFRQFDQNQSVVNYFSLFEVHITLGFKSEVFHIYLLRSQRK